MNSQLLVAVAFCTLPLAMPAASFYPPMVPARFAFTAASTIGKALDGNALSAPLTGSILTTSGLGTAFTWGAEAGAAEGYVRPAAPAVPEPGSLFLLGSGFARRRGPAPPQIPASPPAHPCRILRRS